MTLLSYYMASSNGRRPGPWANGSPQKWVERLLRKFRGTDDPSQLQQGLEIAYGLATNPGGAERCLKDAENLIKSQKLDPSALDGLRRLTDLLEMDQLDGTTLVLDLRPGRGARLLRRHRLPDKASQCCGPSRGWWVGTMAWQGPWAVDRIFPLWASPALLNCCSMSSSRREGHLSGARPGQEPYWVLASSGEAYRKALRLAREMRDSGATAEMDLYGRTVEDARSYARANGIVEIISVDGNGKSTEYRVQEG